MPYSLVFWKERQPLTMSPAAVAQELTWGEDVDGLIDLPIKEIIDRLKAEFPQHRETPGLLTIETGGGKCLATWTWQFVRLECQDVPADERQRLIDVLEEFGCPPYDPQTDER